MDRRSTNPWTWQDELNFSQAVEVAGATRTLYCAGQISVDADGAPLHLGDMEAQFHRALDNLELVLSQAGFALGDLVRLNYYVTDIPAFHEAKDRVGARLVAAGCKPSSTLLGVNALAMPGIVIEIEATAARVAATETGAAR